MKTHLMFKWAAAASLVLSLLACEDSTGPETPLPQLQKWTFSGSEISFKSGIAVRGRDFDDNLTSGITVWLTDQSMDCSNAPEVLARMRGGWIGIKYPEISLGKGKVRLMVGHWPGGPGVNGNIDVQATATLSEADTSSARQVSGSLDFHDSSSDPEDNFGSAHIKGSFSVPYCSGE
jgi:hypothetical protein